MIKLILFSSLLVSALAQINPSGCGKKTVVSSSIVGGTVSKTGAWPWIVSMRWTGSHICGASLLNANWVVTAAHCVDGYTAASYYPSYSLQIGATNRNSPNTWTHTRNVNLIIKHPSYNKNTFENDVALMRLSTPAVIDGTNVVPACLPRTASTYAGLTSYAAGWGTLSSGSSSIPAQLYEVALPMTTDASCTSYYGSSYRSASMVCAGAVGDGKDTCQGDSGGPLNLRDSASGLWNVIGLTSWGRGCGDIGVYTRVSSYTSWIEQQINAN